MKKLVLSLFITAGFYSMAQAQGFVSEKAGSNDSSVVTGASGTDVKVYNRIKAVSGTVKVKWNATSYSESPTAPGTFANGWSFSGICDNEGCRDAAAVLNKISFTSSDYAATTGFTNSANDFHAQFNADNASSNSIAWIRASVADASNPSSARTFTFVAYKSAQGVTTVNRYDDNIVVYPNPATSEVNVLFDKGSKINSIAVYNLIGQVTDMYRVTGGSAKLQLNNAPAGIYFLRMLDDRGNVVATRRFNRQ